MVTWCECSGAPHCSRAGTGAGVGAEARLAEFTLGGTLSVFSLYTPPCDFFFFFFLQQCFLAHDNTEVEA